MKKEVLAWYEKLFGFIPENIRQRLELASQAEHPEAFEAIEQFRKTLIHENPLERKIQQMVHFALLIGANHSKPALYHAKGALKAGATVREMFGICETAAITGGMPAFTLATEVLYQALREVEGTSKNSKST